MATFRQKVINPFAGRRVDPPAHPRAAAPHIAQCPLQRAADRGAPSASSSLPPSALSSAIRTFARRPSRRDSKMWTPGFMFADEPPTLGGRNALILGYGAIGSRVAAMLHGMGMQVHACRRNAGNKPTFDGVATVHELSSSAPLLPTVHVLMICLPGTKATDGLIGQKELKLCCRQGALLVNVGRGSVVDERGCTNRWRVAILAVRVLTSGTATRCLPGTGMGGGDSPSTWGRRVPTALPQAAQLCDEPA